MESNVDYVAFVPYTDSSWTFKIAGNARRLSEEVGEISHILHYMLETCDDFFLPAVLEYAYLEYAEDYPANYLFFEPGTNVRALKFAERKIESTHEVSYGGFVEDLQHAKSTAGVGELRRISVDGKVIFFLLKGKEISIGRNTLEELHADEHSDNEVKGWTIAYPLMITIFHYKGKTESDPAYYEIVFRTWADIWFEDTEVGLANRNRLRHALKSIYDHFNVVDTYFNSDWYSERQLKNVVFGHD